MNNRVRGRRPSMRGESPPAARLTEYDRPLVRPAESLTNVAVVDGRASNPQPQRGRDVAEEALVVARGKRVYLRTLLPADLDHVAVWAEDPFLERMVGSEFLHSYKHTYDKSPSFYDACLTDSSQIVFIVMPNEGERRPAKPLGLVRLFNIHMLEGYAFLETMITDLHALRKGFGVEAGRLISFYGVDALMLRRIEAKVYEYNVLSVNALKRNGFHLEGTLRKAGFQTGEYWDVLVFGILRDEIEKQRQKDEVIFPFDGPEGEASDTP